MHVQEGNSTSCVSRKAESISPSTWTWSYMHVGYCPYTNQACTIFTKKPGAFSILVWFLHPWAKCVKRASGQAHLKLCGDQSWTRKHRNCCRHGISRQNACVQCCQCILICCVATMQNCSLLPYSGLSPIPLHSCYLLILITLIIYGCMLL